MFLSVCFVLSVISVEEIFQKYCVVVVVFHNNFTVSSLSFFLLISLYPLVFLFPLICPLKKKQLHCALMSTHVSNMISIRQRGSKFVTVTRADSPYVQLRFILFPVLRYVLFQILRCIFFQFLRCILFQILRCALFQILKCVSYTPLGASCFT